MRSNPSSQKEPFLRNGADLISETFGDDVASIVAEVTDDKEPSQSEEKAHTNRDRFDEKPVSQDIKLADKTSNLRAVAASPSSDWSVKRRVKYVEFARKVVAGLRGVNSQLEEQFDEAARAADRSFRPDL
jgi:guanosine-3',5'-bis(diphosphate) 3'-pyrophosphohydrolase